MSASSKEMFEQFDSQLLKAAPLLSEASTAPKLALVEKPDKTELHKAHATTITASNAYKIMGKLESPELPASAMAHIETMLRGEPRDITTPAMQWGIDNELKAIAALEYELKSPIIYTGAEQQRFYFGDFVSALPDGVLLVGERMTTIIEVKCLNTNNHIYALTNITSSESLKIQDWNKYCQVQTQMLCADVKEAFLAFYDPRYSKKLHTVVVHADQEWKKTFLSRVSLALAYYNQIKTEDSSKSAFAVSDTPAPEMLNLPRINLDIRDVAAYHKTPEILIERIQQQAGSFVFDVSISKGRDACRSHAANIIRCITPALTASKAIAAEAKKVQEADLYFRKTIEKGIRAIADHTRAPLTDWEYEQARIAEEQAKLEQEVADKIREAQQLIADWDAALTENELFDFRKDKAERVAKEQEAIKEQQRLAHERHLQERAEQAKQQAEREAKEREQRAIDNERKQQELHRQKVEEEQKRLDDEAKKKASNRAHRQRVNGEIVGKLLELGINKEQAKLIIKAAVKRELGAIVVNY